MTLKTYDMQDYKLGHTHVAKKTSLVSISVLRMILRKTNTENPLCVSKKKSNVCSSLYATKYCLRY